MCKRATRLAFACVSVLLAACGGAEGSRTAELQATPVSGSLQASETPSAPPATDDLARLHLNKSQGWSIVLPAGWEVELEHESGTAVVRDGAIAEILLAPSSGLSLDELEAQRVNELRNTWQGIGDIQSDIVSLPVGNALRLAFETGLDTNSPVFFFLYVIEEADTQYVISVRGSPDDTDLAAEAVAIAQSFDLLD